MKLLKIDLDFKPPREWIDLWLTTRFVMLSELGYKVERMSVFKTKRGVHIYIKLKEDVDDETANLLQFLCGDDASRVKINMWRIQRGIPFWNKLFERKIYTKRHKYITCYYCGNKIPIDSKLAKHIVNEAKEKKINEEWNVDYANLDKQ